MEVSDQEKEMRNVRADYNIIENSTSNITALGSVRVPEIAPADQLQEDDADHLDGPDAIKQAAATTLRKPTAVGDAAGAGSARYLECHRNHAASAGGLALDGCREFMQGSGEDGSPDSMRCAACNCHRNFHRKADADMRYGAGSGSAFYGRSPTVQQSLRLPPPPLRSPVYLHHHYQQQQKKIIMPGTGLHHAQPMSVAFGGAVGAESSSEDVNAWQMEAAGAVAGAVSSSKKRFRTKFTEEQKQKMVEFAEKVGWRIQNQDETEIQRFCAEVGVRRQVFKVWIHNNKNSLKHHHNNHNNNPDDDQPHPHQN